MKRIVIIKVMLLACVLFCSGCSLFMPFIPKDTYNGAGDLILQSPKPDVLDIIADVGESIKYHVSILDREKDYIELIREEPFAMTMFTGRNYYRVIEVTPTEEGKKLKVAFGVRGYWGTGKQKEGLRIYSEFTQKLLERLGETGIPSSEITE